MSEIAIVGKKFLAEEKTTLDQVRDYCKETFPKVRSDRLRVVTGSWLGHVLDLSKLNDEEVEMVLGFLDDQAIPHGEA